MTLFTNSFTATFRRSSAKARCCVAARRSTNSIPKTVCSMCRPVRLLGVKPSTNLLVISVRPTRTLFTRPHGEPQALHNAGRLAWGSGPRGEAPEYTGMDVIIVRDGKIAALYVFLDSMPS